ncbi:murein hydrolase activator EnvC [Mesorhizobium sp. BAC0120]|uniref:murein hydrolase activator EnvC family protein n=1 Tax=Mesorhizobium sp. BAC0120 TaxID=3090670 RepID=UPI00298D3D3B|nr:murein hydrolase activator EnvC [Mesorhizobium sp. BAC0120]MDW6021668.1 murein hydrolase activator EnvC [Mesorhizobium sp. BAC0120]
MFDRSHARLGIALLLAAMMVAAVPHARAQEIDGEAGEIEARQAEKQAELDRVSKEITLSDSRVAALTEEIAGIKKDHASITAALIQAAKTERKLSEDIEGITSRLEDLKERQQEIRLSLSARRDVLAEVLGALERMGLNPPPALLVKPEDALSSIRSAILLGAVVPEIRGETEKLMADLTELSRIAATIEAERGRLTKTVEQQAEEKKRLSLLLDGKKDLQDKQEAALADEQSKAAALAEQAGSLKDLIASIQKEIEDKRSAEEKARRAEEERKRREAALAAMSVPELNRLAGPQPFSALMKQIALPVAGAVARHFGDDDGNGGVMHGDTVTTQSGAIVTAPSDGDVLYAGPFRSYGQLLILNAGDGYHVVLAGMGRISVVPGQSVLAGEPVGVMGEAGAMSASASGNGKTVPELYIEFRKDGKPVDPAPWWSVRMSGRTGNDT